MTPPRVSTVNVLGETIISIVVPPEHLDNFTDLCNRAHAAIMRMRPDKAELKEIDPLAVIGPVIQTILEDLVTNLEKVSPPTPPTNESDSFTS